MLFVKINAKFPTTVQNNAGSVYILNEAYNQHNKIKTEK